MTKRYVGFKTLPTFTSAYTKTTVYSVHKNSIETTTNMMHTLLSMPQDTSKELDELASTPTTADV